LSILECELLFSNVRLNSLDQELSLSPKAGSTCNDSPTCFISSGENRMQSNSRLNKLQLLALLTLLFAAAFAMAQGIVTGSISGTVEDAQGAVVTNAKISAKEVATNREYSGEISSSGSFTLRALPPGTYTVIIDAPN